MKRDARSWLPFPLIFLAAIFLARCGNCGDSANMRATPPIEAGADAKTEAGPSPSALDAASEASANVAASFDDLPDAGAAELETRAKHLLEAIANNDPTLAADIVLPREAYISARDAQDPAALYDSKFRSGFANQVARVHRHEKGMERAIFVSFDIGPNPSRESPKHHDWKEPLWRVTRSALTFTIDGRVHRLEINEMIAWRGNWYVAKLR